MEDYNPTNLTHVHFPRERDNQNLVRTVHRRKKKKKKNSQNILYEESGSEQSKGRTIVATNVSTSGLKPSFPTLPLPLGVLKADGCPRPSAEIGISLKRTTSSKVIPVPQESPLSF